MRSTAGAFVAVAMCVSALAGCAGGSAPADPASTAPIEAAAPASRAAPAVRPDAQAMPSGSGAKAAGTPASPATISPGAPVSSRSAAAPPVPSATAPSRPAGTAAGTAAVAANASPAVAARPISAPAKAPEPPPAAAPLDLKSLETRLKATPAIGVFTKLALKNQVDDLLDQFRGYHKGQAKASLGDLRRSYDLLLMKVMALLQDTDQPLAAAISSSRESIWAILSNPTRFSAL